MQIIYRYIVCILLFTCLGFTQDTLITKQGKQYIGKVIDSDSKSVKFYFSGWDTPKRFYLNSAEVLLEPKVPKSHPIYEVSKTYIFKNYKNYKNYKDNKKKLKKEKKILLMEARRNFSISEKLFIDEKAIYYAKLIPMGKWYFYFPAIGTLFIGSLILDAVLIHTQGTPNSSPLTIGYGLYIPYDIYKRFYLENKNEIKYPPFDIWTKSEKILYKHSYNKTLKKRKIKNALIGAAPFIAFSVYLANDFFPSSGPDLPDF